MASSGPEASEPQVVFRPGKKRKIYRQRAGDEAEVSPHDAPAAASEQRSTLPATILSADGESQDRSNETGLSVAEALRLRNARKGRLGGVNFRAGPTARNDEAETSQVEQRLVPADGGDTAEDAIGGMVKQFAPQTGLVGELVNKHM
jgi:hypothetical protein